MSSEDAQSVAGGINPSAPLPVVEEITYLSNSNLPHELIQLKQDLNVLVLMIRADLRDLGDQDKWNQQQVVKLAGPGYGRTKIKGDIKKGKLQTLPSGWVTKEQLIKYLGFDPIQKKIEKVIFYQKEIIRLTEEIEQIILSGQNRPIATNCDQS